MSLYQAKLINNFKSQDKINFDEISTITPNDIINLNNLNLNENDIKECLEKVVVLKLNGGLGTSMGCTGPKSLITIKNDYNFIDIICLQIKHLNDKYDVDIPLIFMNSLNTEEETKSYCSKYDDIIKIHHFNQNFLPRLNKDFEPLRSEFNDANKKYFYPPGHGDVYNSFMNSPLYQEMISLNIEYLFISNCDNLGATVNPNIIKEMISAESDFCLEIVNKTLADVKGGTFIINKDRIQLLEVAQVPKEHLDSFYNIEKFKYFNTNNLWIKLNCLNEDIKMEVIYNPKKIGDVDVVQLEIAMGSAIQSFSNSKLVLVDRKRFRPVKKFKDLYLINSHIFELSDDYELVAGEIPEFEFDMSIKSMDKYLEYIEGKTFFKL